MESESLLAESESLGCRVSTCISDKILYSNCTLDKIPQSTWILNKILLFDSNFNLNFFIILFYINYKCFVPSCASDKQSHIKRHFFRLYLNQDFYRKQKPYLALMHLQIFVTNIKNQPLRIFWNIHGIVLDTCSYTAMRESMLYEMLTSWMFSSCNKKSITYW